MKRLTLNQHLYVGFWFYAIKKLHYLIPVGLKIKTLLINLATDFALNTLQSTPQRRQSVKQQNEISTIEIQSGDIVFISIPNYLYRKVSQATGSPASHVGIAFVDDDGRCHIAESRVPRCTFTPLEKYLARSDQGWYCVRRLKQTLTNDEIAKLRLECEKRQGEWYHFGFNYESDRQFCSKYVHDVFLHAVGLQVGELRNFKQLLLSRPNTPILFWRLWFLGRIPWNRLTITPESQMHTNALETVHSSF